ncbi:hypothetical protein V8F20_002643 [Naviculisporaceae sp. PSN 640]
MNSDTSPDTIGTSTTTVTITVRRSKTSTSTQQFWTLDDPTPKPTRTLITTVTRISTVWSSAPTFTSIPPATSPTPNSRLKTGLVAGSICALVLMIILAFIAWYLLRRRRYRKIRIRHANTRLHELKEPKKKKKKASASSPSSPSSNTFTSISKRNPNLIGLEYVVSRSSTGQSDGIIREHTRDTLPPPLPADRLNKPFIENLHHILGHGHETESDTESEWHPLSVSVSAMVPPLNVPSRSLTPAGNRVLSIIRSGEPGIGQQRYAADTGSVRSGWMSGALPPPEEEDEAAIKVQTGGDGWV